MKGQDQIGVRDALPVSNYNIHTPLLNEYFGRHDYLLSLIVAERDGLEIAIHNCLGSEGGSWKGKRRHLLDPSKLGIFKFKLD
jgi:hypothetical protein